MRTTKKPDERKTEILDKAENLFVTIGYSKTTIERILTELGIAKGTFYYYFDSKEEVMDAIIARHIDESMLGVKAIVSDTRYSPIEKIQMIVRGTDLSSVENGLIEQLHKPENAEMHQKSLVRSILSLAPMITEVVRDGISGGVFATDYPQEAVECLLASFLVLFDHGIFSWSADAYQAKLKAFGSIADTLLGARAGTFSYLKEMID